MELNLRDDGVAVVSGRPAARASLRMAILLLVAAVVIGIATRVYRLGERTITHPEMYVPMLELPPQVYDPPQRMTPLEVLNASMGLDIHPPGYHLIMLAWNSTFGTDLAAIRASSVVFGVLAIVAVFAYASSFFGTPAAVLAAWILALHGGHVFWSQVARPWVLLSLIGLVSALLLIRLQRKWGPWTAIGYSTVAAAGLWTDYYFWPLFGAQMAWVLLSSARQRRIPTTFAAQVIALILATPVFIYLHEHMSRPAHLGGPVWPHVVQMLQFGGMWNHEQAAVDLGALSGVFYWLLAIGGATALVAGLRATRDELDETDHRAPSGLMPWLLVAAAGISIVTELVFARAMAMGHRKLVVAALAAPWLLVALWVLASATWRVWSAPLRWIARLRFSRPWLGLPALLSLGLMLLLVVLHLRQPLLVSYALMAFAPFWVAPMAGGVLQIRPFRAPVVALVLAVALVSTVLAERTPNSGRDYKTLAMSLRQNIRKGDLIWMPRAWFSTPMLYYLKPSHYQIDPPPLGTGRVAERAAAQSAPRIWVIQFGAGNRLSAAYSAIEQLLPGHRQAQRLSAHNAAAVLFVRVQ